MKVKVVKVGGAFLDDPSISNDFFSALFAAQEQQPVVLVHGGGSSVEKLLKGLSLTSQKVNGLRVTPKSQIDYVVGALAGTANKNLCALAKKSGLNPVGLSLLDGNITHCHQISEELGNVGSAEPVDQTLLTTLLAAGFLPIVSSIGADDQGELLNINADQAATAIAKLLNAQLVLLSDVAGVLDHNKSLINKLTSSDIETLISDGVIRDGMTVKVEAALDAANQIGQSVTIASWKNLEILTQGTEVEDNASAGTTIFPSLKENK
ncbi:acetylglutamate kinase [Aliiglaciecola sp. 3_MG-2023]|uniref:acetylglutamate kinase n=1 Tax=Aliiglaciecola sp. 3_MG-2023 TaxID=3062644 RepID=UPI0026E14BD1|nr:acetylglutamate kinase [Aliiglaciecola sp. 3_MG-2023]MDO6692040.1 acetylglutamate kinase [Aliiglaciecola sp. 3_MG-2023]